jgi:hypothetical protein
MAVGFGGVLVAMFLLLDGKTPRGGRRLLLRSRDSGYIG